MESALRIFGALADFEVVAITTEIASHLASAAKSRGNQDPRRMKI